MKLLGAGAYSYVYLSGEHAVKVYRNPDYFDHYALREISLLKAIQHRNIVKLVRVAYFQDVGYRLYMEYGGETLATVLDKISDPKPYVDQLKSAVGYLAFHNIIHRDIKPHNILINGAELKICDFGLSRYCGNNTRHVGTVAYTAPEILRGKQYGIEVDIWSLGCVIYEMYARQPLFSVESDSRLLEMIEMRERQWGSQVPPDFCEPELCDYLRIDPGSRIKLSESGPINYNVKKRRTDSVGFRSDAPDHVIGLALAIFSLVEPTDINREASLFLAARYYDEVCEVDDRVKQQAAKILKKLKYNVYIKD